MPSAFEAVANQALALAPEDRIRLANELQIVRRITQIDAGAARGRAWED